jgi:hypothetical protein
MRPPSFTAFSSRAAARLAALGLGLALSACGGGGSGGTTAIIPVQPTPIDRVLTGQTSFVSADNPSTGINGGYATLATMTAVPASTATDTAARTVQEGDIYRVLDAGKAILNLNSYRGLQIIDISNTAKPTMLGRAAMAGTPLEMYRVGDRVYVLLNNWTEYRRTSKGGVESLERFNGAGLITVDISNRATPKIVATSRIAGSIQTSRLTSGGGKNSIYLSIIDYNNYSNGYAAANVQSFSINASGIPEARSTLDLGSYVTAIQATGERLMAASGIQQRTGQSVTIIDISSPDGTMVKGGQVQVNGTIQKKTNMHIDGNIMRIVSGNNWSSITNTNHVETFNISDIAKPTAIDHDTFGDGQQLFATTFLSDRAFFVTYLRKDPFHAFSITSAGVMKEESEFIVTGWNDFFTPVQGNTRLIGVGHNDESNSRKLAVSMYDITNLKNANPLLMRAEIDLGNAYSEANWDDRAFSVLENATSATAADGKTAETGLVLLPFSGWDIASQQYRSGVQLFTFSSTTLTRRGEMKQDSQVRRSFLGDSNLAANLSDSELSLFNIKAPDAPAALGKLALAPNYSQFQVFGTVGARYHVVDNAWWGTTSARNDLIEFVSLADVDATIPVGSISVPSGSTMYNVAGKLVVVSRLNDSKGTHTTIASYEVSAAGSATLLGKMTTDDLVQSSYYGLLDMRICPFAGPCGGYGFLEAQAVGNALVFSNSVMQVVPLASSTAGTSILPRYASSYVLQVVDLTNPAKPALLPKIAMAGDEDAVTLVQDGTTLWVNYKKSQVVASNAMPMAKYYAKSLNLSVASAPVLGAEINIPGQLVKAVGDTFYTYDYAWNHNSIDTTLAVSIVDKGLAYLQASTLLTGQYPSSLLVDAGTIYLASYDSGNGQNRITIYTLASQKLTAVSSTELTFGPTLKAISGGKLLVQSYEGYLLYDVSKPAAIVAQSYFPSNGWSNSVIVQGKLAYLAAGPFGMFMFNFDTVNLANP